MRLSPFLDFRAEKKSESESGKEHSRGIISLSKTLLNSPPQPRVTLASLFIIRILQKYFGVMRLSPILNLT